jgi:hydrogenase nickel insertion protein HypA
MHELSIVQKIITAVEAAAEKNGIAHVKVVRMRIGQMAAAGATQLQIGFKAFTKGNRLENAGLEIEEVKVRLKCKKCAHVFADARFDDHNFAHTIAHAPQTYTPPDCPRCSGKNAIIVNGQEMELLGIKGDQSP